MKTVNRFLALILLTMFCAGCSTTSNLPEGEVLYTGLKKINYLDRDSSDYSVQVEEEVEAALTCAPNGALLGSSYYRTPFQLKLWIYNRYANSTSKFGKWMLKTFGHEPVLVSYVSPKMRALVAKNLLRSNGYFNADVGYEIIPQKNPKKAKISYTVKNNQLYTIDTIKYLRYPAEMDSLIHTTMDNSRLRTGEAFAVSSLDAERNRLNSLFRDNGFYFYRSAYSVFLADSVSNPGRVELHMQPVAGMPAEARRKWYLGRMRVELRRSAMEQLTDSIIHRNLSVYYSGKKPPIRLRTLLRDIKLRRKQLYSQTNYQESAGVINSLGLFSMSDFKFTPRDTTAACDTLDMTLNCVFDKPYDGSIEANYMIKSNDRTGPGLVLNVTKRNAFRGGEKLNFSLKGSYEWQTGRRVSGGSSSAINSYEYGADISVEYPRIEAPFGLYSRHRFYKPPSTLLSLSGNVLNRANYFKMLTVTAGLTYKFQTSPNSRHEFSPLLLDYNFLRNTTATFDSIMTANPAIYVSMRNQFVPKIKYTYTYTSPTGSLNPILWETTVTEGGNLLSLFYVAAGKDFSKKGKGLFGNPFAQFVKLNTSLRKTWQTGQKSQLVGRVAAGILWAYGNSDRAPYNEQFYVGGANSIRAFTVRSIGPGKYVAPNTNYAYLDQTGDIKLELNLEYRFNLFGNLYGATFLDAGNIWLLKKDPNRPDSEFKPSTFFRQLATGTGVGLRYDMDFIVLRLDLGVAIHVPYDTGKSGYYNIPKFWDGVGLHFAIGYPF
ncbi:BamA/TamA family outer membrane protein [Xylanibacter rodentium]|uniref:translocation and assembly module lipoprotein TamL n=2 Tax=Xylanibacter rodentium TaxID=2736289 RepID=UPI0015550628|nr:BamA/TamA family outer membrane protein [Xylanibacter rodentium]NPE11673.1 BamA/TamA family outer membrane protein [Prevotella sp. PJ1A]NPE38563.1 BamA/TamA family outer membrane protein [Prevotella sp. PCJ2]